MDGAARGNRAASFEESLGMTDCCGPGFGFDTNGTRAEGPAMISKDDSHLLATIVLNRSIRREGFN